MRLRMAFGAVLLIVCCTSFCAASVAGDDPIAGEVKRDVEKTLDLWRDGRYEEVYSRVIMSGNHTKEYLVSYLASAPRRPACCWEKMQDVNVTVRDDAHATLKARFGLDSGAGIEFMTRGLKLEKEDRVWKIKVSELLSLSGKGKKVRGGKK